MGKEASSFRLRKVQYEKSVYLILYLALHPCRTQQRQERCKGISKSLPEAPSHCFRTQSSGDRCPSRSNLGGHHPHPDGTTYCREIEKVLALFLIDQVIFLILTPIAMLVARVAENKKNHLVPGEVGVRAETIKTNGCGYRGRIHRRHSRGLSILEYHSVQDTPVLFIQIAPIAACLLLTKKRATPGFEKRRNLAKGRAERKIT